MVVGVNIHIYNDLPKVKHIHIKSLLIKKNLQTGQCGRRGSNQSNGRR